MSTTISDTGAIAAVKAEQRAAPVSRWQLFAVLFKVRVVGLLLFAAVGGAFLAAGGMPALGPLGVLLLAGGLAASGSAALNEYFERESDSLMIRTRLRPLVTGAIERPAWVPYASALMIIAPCLAVLPFNPALAFFLFLGAVIYVGVYTLWLKPRTLVNIVIGGAAGSAAVLSGSAAVGAWNNPGALVLAALLFAWTPTHFWSLAIVYREDYLVGGTPMLPARVSVRQSAWWVLLHTAATALAALSLAVLPGLDWLYTVPVSAATVALLALNIGLIARPQVEAARRLFHASNLYLVIVLLMICVDILIT